MISPRYKLIVCELTVIVVNITLDNDEIVIHITPYGEHRQ
jgi:hypothetical protein